MRLADEALLARWRAAWPAALDLWSHFTKLREPAWCFTAADEQEQQLSGSFAMIRLTDHTVVISLRQITELHLEDYAPEVLGHEIGHHVYCPADLTDEARLMVRIRAALPGREEHAGLISNLYSDLLINDRLARSRELRMGDIYERLASASNDPLWTIYMRICEILWSLEKGTLARGDVTPALDADAMLGARVIRSYASDWLRGAGRFAALCFHYLESAAEVRKRAGRWLDASERKEGGVPEGLSEIEDDEVEGAIHPALDEALSGIRGDSEKPAEERGAGGKSETGDGVARKRYREPGQYADILRSLGVELPEDQIIARYYRERALPHLVPFPQRQLPQSAEPLAEGTEAWDVGESLEDLDVLESLLESQQVVPGFTTRKRVYGTMAGTQVAREPLDLYVGIDCSGSMGNARVMNSWPVLAGTIVALSALRAGSRVKVVLSGEPGRYASMPDFGRDELEILTTITTYLGTGYAFGIHRLAETFDQRKATERPVHILIVSDHDIFAMLGETRGSRDGWAIARQSVAKARGGGTYVLNMPLAFEPAGVTRMRDEGWNVSTIQKWDDIVAFAREFSRATFGDPRPVRRSG